MKETTEKKLTVKFIDLFAGIGGIRLAFKKQGGTCVFSSEWDKFAQQTYSENFHEVPAGDIRLINETDIPAHLTKSFQGLDRNRIVQRGRAIAHLQNSLTIDSYAQATCR